MPHGDGRIYKRGRVWWIAYSVEGKEFRESARSSDENIAEQLLATRTKQHHQRMEAMVLRPKANPKLKELGKAYLLECTLRGLRLPSVRKGIEYVCDFFAWFRPEEIKPSTIRGYQKFRIDQGAAPATVNREMCVLSGMLNLACLNELIEVKPKFPSRLKEATPRQGFFEHGDYLAIRSELQAWAQDVLDFAYYTGWRRMEIIRLGWDEVFFNDGDVFFLTLIGCPHRE